MGRFNDECTRIRDTKFEEVDELKESQLKGNLEKTIEKVLKEKAKAANLGKTPNRSLLEFEDKHRTN